jgi:hypothetical protein
MDREVGDDVVGWVVICSVVLGRVGFQRIAAYIGTPGCRLLMYNRF